MDYFALTSDVMCLDIEMAAIAVGGVILSQIKNSTGILSKVPR